MYILLFIFLCSAVTAQSVKVIQSNVNSLIIEYTPNYSINDFKNNDDQFQSINVDYGQLDYNSKPGSPNIHKTKLIFAAPSFTGNSYRVISVDSSLINGLILPIPFYSNKSELPTPEYNISDNYYEFVNDPLVTIGEYGNAADLPIGRLSISPIRFYPTKSEIYLINKIRIQVFFGNKSNSLALKNPEKNKDLVLNKNILVKSKITNNSVAKVNNTINLSQGVWYKFETPTEGMYSIDRTTLASMGVDVGSVDPRTIKIYNSGGRILPFDFNLYENKGLYEVALKIVGEEDGKFDEGDRVIFYGRGTDFYSVDSLSSLVKREKNKYSQKNFFFITSGGLMGKRMYVENSLNNNTPLVSDRTIAHKVHEEDKFNIYKSGVIYVSDEFNSSNNNHTYISTLSNRIAGSIIKYNLSFVSAFNYGNGRNVNLQVYDNNIEVFSRSFGYASSGSYTEGSLLNTTFNSNIDPPQNRSALKIVFNTTTSKIRGYLNYFTIEYYKSLFAENDNLIFYSPSENGIVSYTPQNFSNSGIKIFNVSKYSDVIEILPTSISGGQATFQRLEKSTSTSKYIATTENKFLTPTNILPLNNSTLVSDLIGAEFIIITVRAFENSANQYKLYKENDSPDKLSTKVVFVDDIYNEFSSGSLDPGAIRDFLKFAYNNWQVTPEYVLLLGDGNYDYYNLENLNNNFIPTYQTTQSFHYVDSYCFDDFYSRINGENFNQIKDPDVAIGRINVQSSDEVLVYLDKIKEYEDFSNRGGWNTKITLLADDGWTTERDDGNTHTRQSEELVDSIPQYMDLQKVYLAAFNPINTSQGRRKPDVNKAIIDAINNGCLIFNYYGHGNPNVWAHEYVFEKNTTISQLNNNKYFFLTAATCDFGKYDDPSTQSSTEEMLLLKDRGMIGGFSASRPVYSSDNHSINRRLFAEIFKKDQSNIPVRIGDAFLKTKIKYTSSGAEKFHLFGDPTVRLNIPRLPLNIDSVNGSNLSTDVQIKALGKVKINGKVLNSNGAINSDFNGEGIISVFDSERNQILQEINNYPVTLQGGVIFRGSVSVNNGSFETEFIVPKDISYENKKGKVVAYLFSNNNDAIGVTNNIIVGGTDSSNTNDNNGPEIDVYFDDINNPDAYLVNNDFKLIVQLEDQTGLNTTGTGIGHKLEGVLNENYSAPIDFTNFFIGDLDAGGKSGQINYNFSDLPEGDYTLEVKAWDVFNNPNTEETGFSVISGNTLAIRNVVNYPNPFKSNTTFTFQHNLVSNINVSIKIYTVAGRLIKIIDANNISNKFVRIPWDGRDDDGDYIANGTYLYNLKVESTDGQFKDNILGKLAVIR